MQLGLRQAEHRLDVPYEQLADDLWPDAEGDAGRRAFDTTLHRLRRRGKRPNRASLM